MSPPDRPIQSPERHFAKLVSARHELHRLMDRYPSRNADWRAFSEAAEAVDRAALHFGLEQRWWWRVASNGGRIPPDHSAVDLGCPWAETGLKG